jgi:hypothetical protein
MSRFLAVSALTIMLVTALRSQQQNERISAIRIEAFTSRGERIDKVFITAIPVRGGGDYRGRGRDVVLSVPEGTYAITVQSPGFRTTQRIVNVYGSSVLKTVLLPVASLHGQTSPNLSGQVVGFGGDPMRLRIRLVPMFGAELEEIHPDAGGRFSFRPDPGPYVLMAVVDGDFGPVIADFQQLTVVGRQEVTVDLSKYIERVSAPTSPSVNKK